MLIGSFFPPQKHLDELIRQFNRSNVLLHSHLMDIAAIGVNESSEMQKCLKIKRSIIINAKNGVTKKGFERYGVNFTNIFKRN